MGLSLAFLTALLASSKDLLSKRLAFSVDGTVSAFASFVFALPYYLVLLTIINIFALESFFLPGTALLLLLLRSITDTFAELFKMHALRHADISLAASIFALHPLLVAILSPMITGDKLPTTGYLAMIFIVAGSLVLVKKKDLKLGSSEFKGIVLTLISSICFALNSCFDRLAVQHASPTISAFSMTLLSALFLLVPFLRIKNGTTTLVLHGKLFTIRGLFEVLFMICKLYALQILQAPYVVGILKISTIFSVIGGRVIFKEQDFLRRILAALLILAGILLIVYGTQL